MHHGSPMIKCTDRMWITATANENSGADLHHNHRTSLPNVLRGSKTRGSAAAAHVKRPTPAGNASYIQGKPWGNRSNDEWRRKAAEPCSGWGERLVTGAFEGELKMRGMLAGTTGARRLQRARGIYGSAGVVSGHASALFPAPASCLTRQHQAL